MDPHDTDEDDQWFWNSELFRAVDYGRKRSEITEENIIDKVKKCLCERADIDAVNLNNAGNTVLHVAVKHNHREIIKFLLDNGARIDIENSQGLTAFKLAKKLNCQPEIIGMLENYTKSVTNQLRITYWCKSQTVWNKFRNNSEIAVLEINSSELCPDFLHQIEFYDAIDTAGNLFFVDVMLSHMEHIDEDFIKSQLTRLKKQSIIQCGSMLNTRVYFKDSEWHVHTINFDIPFSQYDRKVLTDKLSSEVGFRLDLIIEAMMLNLVGTFISERRSLLKFKFNFNNHFGGRRLIDYAIRYGDVLTVRLLSLSDWNITRLSDFRSILRMAAQYGNIDQLGAVLRVKFPIQLDKSISIPEETADHFNKCKRQMLETAVRAGNCDVISFMIRCGVQLDRDIIELAWDNKRCNVILLLLKAECAFPDDFDLNQIDPNDKNLDELKIFVKQRDHLHNLIMEGDLNCVKQYVNSIAPSKFYLNKDNRSAIFRALKSHHSSIFVWLKNEINAEFRDDDERRSLGVGVLDSATDALLPLFVPVKNAHILQLVAKSRSHQHYAGFKDHIEAIYTYLNGIPQIATVLKVIQFVDQLDIIYDFDNDSIVDVSIASSKCEKGLCEYKAGRVYIGAKAEKRDLLGIIAHELTHLAMQTIYDNDCKPYKFGDSMNKSFNEVINDIVKQSGPVDFIIRRVFSCYGEAYWPSELIVRVNHMLATYGSTDGLCRLEGEAKSLLAFYQDYVTPCCEAFISESHLIRPRNIIKVLNDYAGTTSKIEESKIRLKKSIDMRVVLCDNNVHITVVTSTHPLLSAMSVYQSLKEFCQQPNSFLIFNFDGYVKRRIDVNQAFYSDVCKFLVLLCESDPEKVALRESLEKLAHVLWKKLEKKIIFIMKNTELFDEVFHCLYNLSMVVHPDIEYTLSDVCVESAALLLDQSVSLQCRDANIKLSSLIYEEHFELVDAQMLLKLINKLPIVIGKQIITSCNYDEHFYINRTFSHQAVIKEDIFRENDESSPSTMFAVSEVDNVLNSISNIKDSACTFNHFDYGHIVEHIILDSNNGAQQYRQLCEKFPQHNIHWLERVCGRFHWLDSRCIRGNLIHLQKFISEQSVDQYSEDNLTNEVEKHHVVLVSDTAGMGKSTVLTSLAQKLCKQNPLLWVIRVNLNDYTNILDKEQKQCSLVVKQPNRELWYFVYRLLESSVETKLETEFEKNLLLHFLQHNEDRVVIMFDGFDEIKRSHQHVIKDVLVALKSSKVKQLWVTTRPHMRQNLENTLHHLTYMLRPLDETEQVNFLMSYWRQRLSLGAKSDVASGCNFDMKLQCFAEALIKLLSASISDREKIFTGVPLQLRMVAECFEEDAEMICKSDGNQPHLPAKLKLNDLYQNFFNRKYKIFQLEKNDVDFSKLNWESQNDVLKEYFLNNHRIASLFTIFDVKECELLLTRDEFNSGVSFINEISNNKLNTGIIDLVIEGKPRFVHMTFAEYLAAEFIVNILAKEHLSIELTELILTKVLYEDNFKVVRAFINSHLGQKMITGAALNEHGRILRSMWPEKPTRSRLGKFISGVFRGNESQSLPQQRNICSVFLITAEEGNANLTNFLLNCLGKCQIQAEVMKSVDDYQMQALHLAAVNGHLDVVKVLIEHKADVNALVCRARKKFNQFNALLLAAYFSYADVCELLINNGADISATVSIEGHFEGHNVLHLAALYGSLAVVKMLKNVNGIDFNAIINGSSFFDGVNALHGAASNRHWDVVKWIVTEGLIDINVTHSLQSYIGQTVLIEAVKKGPPEIVEWLIEHNADVNIGHNIREDTALHIAVSKNKLKVAEMLVSNGAIVNAVNCDRKTPLHLAADRGCEQLVECLLKVKDIEVNAVDIDGRTPLQLASMKDYQNIIEILTKFNAK